MGEAAATLSTVRLRRNDERSVNGFLLFVLIWSFFPTPSRFYFLLVFWRWK